MPKPDGRYRFCVDFRAVNAVTQKNAFPLPNVEDQIQRAAGQKFYTTLDLRDGFWLIPMAQDSIEKTAFSTPDGHFEFLVMPFGLTNAPATFQEFMNQILSPAREFTAGLLDDICLFADSETELEQHTMSVLSILSDNGLILQLRKWFQSSVRFLGLVIDRDGLHTDRTKIDAIFQRPLPSTITKLRVLIHAAAYFRRFVADFSKIVTPLYALTVNPLPKGSPITLNDNQICACKELSAALVSTPTLTKFNYHRRCVLDTDASGTHIGGCLQQPHVFNSKEHLFPVAYESHKLTPTQQRYASQERELLAVAHCCTKFRHWIEGSDLTIPTDHESLTLLRSKIEQPPRIQRFLSQIEHFNPGIPYRPGKEHFKPETPYRPGKAKRVPDWLSRTVSATVSHTTYFTVLIDSLSAPVHHYDPFRILFADDEERVQQLEKTDENQEKIEEKGAENENKSQNQK